MSYNKPKVLALLATLERTATELGISGIGEKVGQLREALCLAPGWYANYHGQWSGPCETKEQALAGIHTDPDDRITIGYWRVDAFGSLIPCE